MPVEARVQRVITDEETVSFIGTYETNDAALAAASAQLELCRAHMVAYNERVRAVDQAKADELDAAIQTKGDEVKRLTAEIEAKAAEVAKLGKRLRSA